jgi:hypothetical protein
MTQTRRTFTLVVVPDRGTGYGIEIRAAVEDAAAEIVAGLKAPRFDRIRPAVLEALVASKHARTVLSPTRRAPIRLTEAAGVSLVLLVLATRPLRKPTRVAAICHGVSAMSSEEALYWYAHVTGPRASRALRALRLLLAEV